MGKFSTFLVAAAMAVASFAPVAANAQAVKQLRFGYVQTLDQLPFYIAQQKGYFAKAGLGIEFVLFNTGPAAASAVAGKSVDFGYASTVPVLVAREQNQPFALFAGLGWEQAPDEYTTFIVASSKSGITSMAQTANKRVAPNTAGGGCELLLRTQLALAQVPWDNVKIITMPFPLMEPALEVGNLDVACVVEPFYSNMLLHDPKARVIGKGYLRDQKSKKAYPVTGLFARNDWLQSHGKEVKAINAALQQALYDIDANPKLARQLMVSEMHLSPELAERVIILHSHTVSLTKSDVQTLIDTAYEAKIIQSAYPASDVVYVSR